MADNIISVEYRGRVAVVTIDNDKKLNSFSQQQYYRLAQTMKEIATHDEVYITVLIGKGRYFSAGADVSLASSAPKSASEQHQYWLANFGAYQINITSAFASHPKILVIGLNGPVIGLSAALTGFADFIYCTPDTFLFTPFSSLGLVAEGGSSRALALRLGPAKANEALIMSKRITAEELKQCGYANEIFEVGKGESEKFKQRVLQEVDNRLGEHLVGDSLIGIKRLIRRPELDNIDVQNVREMLAGLDRFVAGVPQEQFRRLASGEKRHKL